MKLHDDLEKEIRRFPKQLLENLRQIDVGSVCFNCNKNGCMNSDDQPIPCLHDHHCGCNAVCVCECHLWDGHIYRAINMLEIAFDILGVKR